MRKFKYPSLAWLTLFVVIAVAAGSLIKPLPNEHLMTRNAEALAEQHPNRLLHEKSPYLLQHAYNPVDWYPWGPEAFEKARRENKPVFLSIGYSTCHWCHVMERESFEDFEVARLMNESFVSIKVDREERPDIDGIYMNVCQMLTGSGGWPLTIIMTPEKKPFFAGTYIPKDNRFGRLGMLALVPRIEQAWAAQHDEIIRSAEQIVAGLQSLSADAGGESLGDSALTSAYQQLASRYDETYGGFGNTPKFPTPHNLSFLLRYWKRSGDPRALEMVEKTLQAMRQGGVYDHVGFGFHRYSTDAEWLVPHFEKMLYDQALLAIGYTEAFQATGKTEYQNTAREILTYVLRDMTSPGGGFYSAEDADSEGKEGKSYVWALDEIQQVVGSKEADLVIRAFNVTPGGNFSEHGTESTGENILHRTQSLDELVRESGMAEPELEERLEAAREKLFAYREKRPHPHKDDKILTDWNGLMIAALAKAAQAFDEPKYAKAAQRAAEFIQEHLGSPEGRLLHRYRDGQAAVPAHLDDYAFLIWGLIELYETSFDVKNLQAALDLNREVIEHFWDDKRGGFYFTSDDAEKLLVRQKEIYDGAVPSGNSVQMLNLSRLGRMTGNADFEEKAAQVGRAFSKTAAQAPSAFTQLMVGLDFAVGPSHEVVIAGDPRAADTRGMLRALRTPFVPNKVVLLRPNDEPAPEITRLAEFTRNQSGLQGKATVYVCRNFRCRLPTTEVSQMLKSLNIGADVGRH
jgi:uncharacterized protein YyaL (SSP411 family)